MASAKPKTIAEYINSHPPEIKLKLKELYLILKEIAPKSKEAIKWGVPVFEEGRILFSFSAFKSHINFMPTRSTVSKFEKELKGYKTGKDTVQFPYDKPLPGDLIKKLAKYRLKEVSEGSLWMHRSEN